MGELPEAKELMRELGMGEGEGRGGAVVCVGACVRVCMCVLYARTLRARVWAFVGRADLPATPVKEEEGERKGMRALGRINWSATRSLCIVWQSVYAHLPV